MPWVQTAEAVIAGAIAVLAFTVAGLAAVAPKVFKNASDIQALWAQFRAHQTATAGTLASLQRGGGAIPVLRSTQGTMSTPAPLSRSIPLWSQLEDRNPDGSLPGQRFNDCGEECVAMVYRATRGVEVEADYLRFLLKGPGGLGLTSCEDLCTLLRRAWYAPVCDNGTSADALAVAKAALAARRPTIALGRWVSPDFLHWTVVVAIGTVHVDYVDPWYGALRTITIDEWQALYGGSLVDVGEPVKYPPASHASV